MNLKLVFVLKADSDSKSAGVISKCNRWPIHLYVLTTLYLARDLKWQMFSIPEHPGPHMVDYIVQLLSKVARLVLAEVQFVRFYWVNSLGHDYRFVLEDWPLEIDLCVGKAR